jgi:hypothetical protein
LLVVVVFSVATEMSSATWEKTNLPRNAHTEVLIPFMGNTELTH